jgi:hypothetical protein
MQSENKIWLKAAIIYFGKGSWLLKASKPMEKGKTFVRVWNQWSEVIGLQQGN